MNRQTTEDFSSSKNTLCYTRMIDTGHCTFVQTKKCTAPRVNYIVNCGLWVIVMCQWRFISCNKRLTPMGDVDNSGSYVNVGVGSMQEISVPLPHFHREKNMYIQNLLLGITSTTINLIKSLSLILYLTRLVFFSSNLCFYPCSSIYLKKQSDLSS